MTGWRIGFTSSPGSRPSSPLDHNTSRALAISQWAAVEAITGPQEAAAAMKQSFLKEGTSSSAC